MASLISLQPALAIKKLSSLPLQQFAPITNLFANHHWRVLNPLECLLSD